MTRTKKKKRYTGRDVLMVRLINGATKAGAECDKKREASRTACRDWDDEEYEEHEEDSIAGCDEDEE